MIACSVSSDDNPPLTGARPDRIRKNILGGVNRNVASWIYGIISAVSQEAATYAENLHSTNVPGQSMPGRIVKPFTFSLYPTSAGMNIQIRSVSEEFTGWIRQAVSDVKSLPILDLRDSRGSGPVLRPEKVIESAYGKGLKIEMLQGQSPSGRPLFLAKTKLFTLSPLVFKGKGEHLRLSETAFSPEGDPVINQYILANLLVKHANTVNGGSNVPLEMLMEDRFLTVSFSRGVREGWTKLAGSMVPFIEGRFTLTTHPELLYTALNSGIGARTSLGFGMVEMHDSRKRHGE